MNINVRYNIGDKVSWRIPQTGSDDIICPFCNGTKIVQGHDGSTLPCPKCNGRGTVKTIEYREGSSTITGINVMYNSDDLKNYGDGAVIVYYSNSGNVDQRYITGIVSEN